MAAFVALLAVLIAVLTPWGAPWGSVAYVFGALLSAAAGLVGMRIATAANTGQPKRRGAVAPGRRSRSHSAGSGDGVHRRWARSARCGARLPAVQSGAGIPEWAEILAAIGLGGSSVALFARVGAGSSQRPPMWAPTWSARSRRDPRGRSPQPAVIADNVGDNVGDVAGMGADLFESTSEH